MQKSIWILNHYAALPIDGGGTRHFDFAKILVEKGYDVSVFASSFSHRKLTDRLSKGEWKRIENIYGIRWIWLKTLSYQKNDIRRVFNMVSFSIILFFIGLFSGRPSVIVASSVHPLTCLAGYFLAKLKGARYIAEIRDLWPQTAIDMGIIRENSLAAKAMRFMEAFIYRKADRIIVLLPGAIDYMTALGIPKEKIVYIPNGVNVQELDECLERKSLTDNTVETILECHRDAFICLYLGAHGIANALDVIISAAKILQDKDLSTIRFLMVGDGPEKERIINRSKELGLTNVFFHSTIDKRHVPELLAKVDVQLISMQDIPLYKYGISLNKLFDYLYSARPTIFAGKVYNDIVREAQAGFSVEPDNPLAFAESIIKMFHISEHERKQMGYSGRAYIKRYHDISILVNRLEEIVRA